VPLPEGSRDHNGAQHDVPAARRSSGRGTRPSSTTVPPPRLIEIRAMDRETARRNMRAGLVAGGIAAGIFALSFVAAFLYIAQ
jgi:hypothetical protein